MGGGGSCSSRGGRGVLGGCGGLWGVDAGLEVVVDGVEVDAAADGGVNDGLRDGEPHDQRAAGNRIQSC